MIYMIYSYSSLCKRIIDDKCEMSKDIQSAYKSQPYKVICWRFDECLFPDTGRLPQQQQALIDWHW